MATRRNLRDLLQRHANVLIKCPECSEDPMTLKDFRKIHVKTIHNLDPTDCEFCFGDYSWESRQLQAPQTVDHQRKCFEIFRTKYKYTPEPPPESVESPPETPPETDVPKSFDPCSICKSFEASAVKLSAFDREIVPAWKLAGFYEPVFRKPSWWMDPKAIPLDIKSGLGSDTAVMFQRFEEFHWFHVSVKPFAFPHFKKDLTCMVDDFAVLPYDCLCDGLETQQNNGLKHHRHMILAVKKGKLKTFKNIWRRKIRSPLNRNALGKVMKEIKDTHHLAATIHYVGQRQSSCDGKNLNEKCDGRLSHYWIHRPVYPHAILGICTLYPGGLQEYIRLRNKSKLVEPWKDIATLNDRRKYTVPISALNVPIQYCVIPVRRDLQPFIISEQHEEWDSFFRLWMYEKEESLIFRINPELQNLTKDAWYQAQLAAGNCFVASIIQSQYELTFHQQKTMRQLKHAIQELKKELNGKEQEILNLKQKNVNLTQELGEEKQKNLNLTQELETVKSQLVEMEEGKSTAEKELETVKDKLSKK